MEERWPWPTALLSCLLHTGVNHLSICQLCSSNHSGQVTHRIIKLKFYSTLIRAVNDENNVIVNFIKTVN